MSKKCIRWPVSSDRIAGSGIHPLSSSTFLKIIRWQVTTFQIIADSSSIFLICMWNKLCSWAAPWKFWFQTDLGRENSAGFNMQGRQSFLTFLTTVTRWSRSSPNLYALIGQNLTGEFMRKMYAASENLFSDSWSWQSFVSPTCHVFNCLFPLDVQNEYSCYQDSFVIHGWLFIGFTVEKCVAGQNHRKSNFVLHCFRFSSGLMRERVKRLKWFWPYLMAFRSCISTGKPE